MRSPIVRVSLIAIGLVGYVLGCSARPENTSAPGVVIGNLAKPFVIDLGEISTDRPRNEKFIVQNCSSESITVDGYTSSCECTRVTGLPLELAARSSHTLGIVTDMSKEKNFTGGLGIAIELKANGA